MVQDGLLMVVMGATSRRPRSTNSDYGMERIDNINQLQAVKNGSVISTWVLRGCDWCVLRQRFYRREANEAVSPDGCDTVEVMDGWH